MRSLKPVPQISSLDPFEIGAGAPKGPLAFFFRTISNPETSFFNVIVGSIRSASFMNAVWFCAMNVAFATFAALENGE